MTRRYGALLIINDDVDLVLAVNADGVHLGLEDLPLSAARTLLGPGRIIGASVHTVEQARFAEQEGADYLGVGPIFPSPTKQARPPLGCKILREIKNETHIPLIAIGGITVDNVWQALDGGADGAACISAVLSAPDIRKAAEGLLRTIRGKSRPDE